MELKGKHLLILFIILILGLSIISSSSAYTGTGFTHDIPFSKYSDLSNGDILKSMMIQIASRNSLDTVLM